MIIARIPNDRQKVMEDQDWYILIMLGEGTNIYLKSNTKQIMIIARIPIDNQKWWNSAGQRWSVLNNHAHMWITHWQMNIIGREWCEHPVPEQCTVISQRGPVIDRRWPRPSPPCLVCAGCAVHGRIGPPGSGREVYAGSRSTPTSSTFFLSPPRSFPRLQSNELSPFLCSSSPPPPGHPS